MSRILCCSDTYMPTIVCSLLIFFLAQVLAGCGPDSSGQEGAPLSSGTGAPVAEPIENKSVPANPGSVAMPVVDTGSTRLPGAMSAELPEGELPVDQPQMTQDALSADEIPGQPETPLQEVSAGEGNPSPALSDHSDSADYAAAFAEAIAASRALREQSYEPATSDAFHSR